MPSLNNFPPTFIFLLNTAALMGLIWLVRDRRQRLKVRTAPIRNGRYPHHQNNTAVPYSAIMTDTRDAVLNSMDDGMIVLDSQNRIIDVNLSARRIIQKMPADIVGKHIEQVLPILARHIQAAKCKPLDIALGPKEKDRFYELSISAFYNGREEHRGHLLVLRDITERKKLENLRDDLTRTMIHDLRDPISNSLFALEMLKTSLADSRSPDARQLLDLTFASTAKTLQLVDKILEIGRLESGEIPLSLTSIPLVEMVETVLTAQLPRVMNKQLILINDVPESLPPTWADAGLLERVLKNLIDNSIKFIPAGGTIWVTAVQTPNTPPGEPDLLVSVADNGPGLAPELQAKVFDQFVTGSHVESGTGLGLAFCKMALAAQGQRIWVESQPGQGATFTFSLPIDPTRS